MSQPMLHSSVRPAAYLPIGIHVKRHKTLIIAALTAVILSVLAALMLLHARSGLKDDAAAATINGEPVSWRELRQAMSEERAKTAAYFKAVYKADVGPDFWTSNFNGEIPLEKLKKDTVAKMVSLKVQQLMAKREGLAADISYTAFLHNLKDENKRRANDANSKDSLFGPQSYSETAYYSLLNSNLFGALKNKLERDMKWSDDVLRSYYEAHKLDQFTSRDTVGIRKISVSFASAASTSESDAEEAMKQIRSQLQKGISLEAAAEAIKEQASVEDIQLDHDSTRSASLSTPLLVSKVQQLQAGQITDIFKENEAYVLGAVTERKPGTVYAFEEVKAVVQAKLAEEAYNTLLTKEVNGAAVIINHRVYDQINAAELQ